MKFIAALIMVLSLLVGIVPQLTDCQSQGKAVQLANGNAIPMKCHWTARAEIGLAVPLLLLGASMMVRRRTEFPVRDALMSIALGALVILMPTTLIGVCARPDMLCAAVMKPTLMFAGGIVVALGVLGVFMGMKRQSAVNGDHVRTRPSVEGAIQ